MVLVITIGNSDNKLTQKRWSSFASHINDIVGQFADTVYFAGASNSTSEWQNACWVFECDDESDLTTYLVTAASLYNQDSIALTRGETELVCTPT